MEPKTYAQFKWEKSVWLSRAQRAFMPKEDKDTINALPPVYGMERIGAAFENMAEAFGVKIPESENSATKSKAEIQRITNISGPIFKTAQERVERWLKSGALVALGFDRQRHIDLDPVQIPTAHWQHRTSFQIGLDWEENTIELEGFKIQQVKLFAPNYEETLRSKWEAAHGPTQAPDALAASNMARNIEAAFKALAESGRIGPETSVASIRANVREFLIKEFPDEGYREKSSTRSAYPANESLRSYIAPLRQELGWPEARVGRPKKKPKP